MNNELITALISAVVGALSGGLVSFLLEKRKEKREDEKENLKAKKEAYENRPEFAVADYKNYTSRVGYGMKQTCDIEVLVIPIENVTITDNKKNGIVNAHYNKAYLNQNDWCCVIYTFKNVGKTDISSFSIICNYQQDTCILPCGRAEFWAKNNMLNYSEIYDQKIQVGETISVKFCYHKDGIITGSISAIMSLGMEDDNGRYWLQPLFAPNNKLYDSFAVTRSKYMSEIKTDVAEECFKKPWLW